MVEKKDIFEINNLELAFQRLKFGSRHLHKQLYWTALKDIEPFRKDYFNLVIEKLSNTNRVDNHSVIRAYLPKKGGFVRPITYMGFEALLIYQSIANKLVESFYGVISKNYNKITFGNHFNDEFQSKFIVKPWKKQWKYYQNVSKLLIDNCEFNYVVDFDIASFYDSIDHKLLIEALCKNLDSNSIEILLSILQLSHSDFKHIKSGSGSGIPQGPVASMVLSEIFLHSYIDEYFAKQIQKNEIFYIRYADDIRIFSKQEAIAKKFITILDLLCRNTGLIPQTSKVGVSFFESSNQLIDQDIKKFSQIHDQYKRLGKLKEKESRKAMNLIKEMFKSGAIDKTKFSFYIYKLEKDDELKNLIITNISDRYEFCEPMLSYLRKNYYEDKETIEKLVILFIKDESFFLDFPVYIFLDKFKTIIEFDEETFLRMFSRRETGKWLSKISLIKWALYWKQKEILDSLNPDEVENVLIKRELLCAQHELTDSKSVKKQREIKMLKNDYPDLSFKSISLIYESLLFKSPADYSLPEINDNLIVKKIINGVNHNPVADTLNKQGKITQNTDNFFSNTIFSDENEFEQLSVLCNFLFGYYQDKNYKLFIDSLDQFNHIMIERLFYLEKGSRPPQDYGALLKNESFISTNMIGVRDILLNIHLLRNGELHPKDIKTGKFHPKDNAFLHKTDVMEKLLPEWCEAIEEILSWYERYKKV